MVIWLGGYEMFPNIQNSFTGGEISPSIFGRTDFNKYHQGCSTLRNFFVNYRGGASSRAGLAYVGKCKQSGTSEPPRNIPFQFNINQGFVLEFGHQYMRIVSNGAYVTEASVTVSDVDTAAVFTTSGSHGFSVGDWVYDTGNTGFNGLTWIIATTPTASTFTVTDLFGTAISVATVSGAGTVARIYTVVSPYAAVDLPYLKYTQSADTMSLCCVNQQTATEYPTYELTRSGNTSWAFTQVPFEASIDPPDAVSVTANASTTVSTWYSYVVTAVDSITGEESVASQRAQVENNDISVNAGSNVISWSARTGASSYNIYKATPSYEVTVPVGSSYGYIGTAFGTSFVDTNITADFTSVPPVHRDPFAVSTITSVNITNGGSGLSQETVSYTITTSTGSGFAGSPVIQGDTLVAFIIDNGGKNYAGADTIAIGSRAIGTYTFTGNPTDGQTVIFNGVTWTFVSGTPTTGQTKIHATVEDTLIAFVSDLNASANASINVATYTLSGLVVTILYDVIGTGGNSYTLAAGTYGGTPSGGNLTGGASGGATATLSVGNSTGTYPGTVAYYQQRRAYGYTLNQPDTYFMSQPGAYTNMDSSIPTTDSDSITGSPWAQQINGIQFMVPMPTGLIVLTGGGAWMLSGGNNSAITPADQTATAQAYNGCHSHIPPLVANADIIYVQSKGSIVRDLSYNFYVNIFTGTDMTVLSNHLFNFHQLQGWAYAEEPYKLVWAVRDDGIMLCLTYLKEQEVIGWSRHDTNGFFVSVCSVVEPPVDAVYVITKRYIVGETQWAYYQEQMDNRNWQNVEDCFCVDAGLRYPMTYPNAILTPSAADGTDNITSINLIYGGSGYTAPTVRAVDPTGNGTGALFSVGLTSGVITSITIDDTGSGYAEGTSLQISDSTGIAAVAAPIITNYVTFTASSSVFAMGNEGDVIRIGNSNAPVSSTNAIAANGGGMATIVTYNSGTEVIANITNPITNVITDDPNRMPAPVTPNQWSLSTPVDEVTGLNHLEGMQVSILADGSVMPTVTVADGSVLLPQEASSIVIGLPYTCQLQTLYLDPPTPTTTQGKRKNIQAVTVRMENSRGMSVGTNQPDSSTQPNNATVPWVNMKEFKERTALIGAGNSIPLFTGDERILVPGEWNKKAQVAVQTEYPIGCSVLAVIPEFSLGDSSG